MCWKASRIKDVSTSAIPCDLRKRVKEHNNGLNFSTKPYLPWQLIYYEACLN